MLSIQPSQYVSILPILNDLKTIVLKYLTEAELEYISKLLTENPDEFIQLASARYNALSRAVASQRFAEELIVEVPNQPNAAALREATIEDVNHWGMFAPTSFSLAENYQQAFETRILMPLIERTLCGRVIDKTNRTTLDKIMLGVRPSDDTEIETRLLQMLCCFSPTLSQRLFTLAIEQLRKYLNPVQPAPATDAKTVGTKKEADMKEEDVFTATDNATIFKRTFIQQLFSLGAAITAEFLNSNNNDNIRLIARAVINRAVENGQENWHRGILFRGLRTITIDPTHNLPHIPYIRLLHDCFTGHPETQRRISESFEQYLTEFATTHAELTVFLKTSPRTKLSELPIELQLKLTVLLFLNKYDKQVANIALKLEKVMRIAPKYKLNAEREILERVNAFVKNEMRITDAELAALTDSYRKLIAANQLKRNSALDRLRTMHSNVRQSWKPRLVKHDWVIEEMQNSFAEKYIEPWLLLAICAISLLAALITKNRPIGMLIVLFVIRQTINNRLCLRLPGGSMSMMELAEYDSGLHAAVIDSYRDGDSTRIGIMPVSDAVESLEEETKSESDNLKTLQTRATAAAATAASLAATPAAASTSATLSAADDKDYDWGSAATGITVNSKAETTSSNASDKDASRILREIQLAALRKRNVIPGDSSSAAANVTAASNTAAGNISHPHI